ncbi:MAG TPA: hypothetical protein EYO33_01935 [Phycisphaerales bacterium]|nr:hypothetical protein [Phycisphaerales bacterium]
MKHGGGTQRWLVSYADMVTLLFALFLVLFAVSSVDNSRLVELADALDKQLKQEKAKPQKPIPIDLPAPQQPLNEPVETFSHLEQRLKGYDVKRTPTGLSVSLTSDGILFESAQATLKPQSRLLLKELRDVLNHSKFVVRIEGHTDSQPISTPRFSSNGELSVMRAWAVGEYFLKDGLNPDRISIMGLGSSRPVADNKTAAGRAANRRVVIHFHLESAPPTQETIESVEAEAETDDSTSITEYRLRTTRVGSPDSPGPDTHGTGPDHSGAHDLFHSDHRGPVPHPSGHGDTEHPAEHRADSPGPISYGAVHGTDAGPGIYRRGGAVTERETDASRSLR